MRPGSLASPRFSWNGASRFEATVPLRAGLAGAVSCTRLPSGGNGNCRQNLFAQDSSLEGSGFEPSVPPGDRNRIASPVCAERHVDAGSGRVASTRAWQGR
jgi:hypothetical protein